MVIFQKCSEKFQIWSHFFGPVHISDFWSQFIWSSLQLLILVQPPVIHPVVWHFYSQFNSLVRGPNFGPVSELNRYCSAQKMWTENMDQIWTNFIVPESVQNFQIVFKNDFISVQTLILIGRFEYCQLGFRARYDTVR